MPDWKDTVMNDKQLEQVEEAYLDEDFSVNFIRLGRGHTEELRLRVAQAQAEITWSIAFQIAVKAVKTEILGIMKSAPDLRTLERNIADWLGEK